jgi:chitin disaccharide deacetylase
LKRIIVTGDDFGLSVAANEAVEEAHRRGILTAASLMVGAGAAEDAVRRARRLPDLGVGLHIVVVRGRPVLPPRAVPDLVDATGRFRDGLVRSGFLFAFRRQARRQLEAEIRAQFAAFRRTGLPLDHVNAHCHMHLHPVVLGLILGVGREYGLEAVRLPREPVLASWRGARDGLFRRLALRALLAPWVILMRTRLRRAGVRHNDCLFGLADSGRMERDRFLGFLARLPRGTSEVFFHPESPGAAGTDPPGGSGGVREFEALMSPLAADALYVFGIERAAFRDLSGPSRAARRTSEAPDPGQPLEDGP